MQSKFLTFLNKNRKRGFVNPIALLNQLGIKYAYVNKAGFLVIHCPFHKNGREQNPSMNIHKDKGYFKCHACGASGSLIDFYYKVTGKLLYHVFRDLYLKEVN